MQTLDLSGASKKSDGRLKSLLWPTVENAWDVDYLGQQGFWICLIIGTISFVFIAVFSVAIYGAETRVWGLILGAATFFVFFVGGMGVRQSDWLAAATIFAVFALNQLGTGRPPSILSIIVGAVLLSNVRATFIASRWKPVEENEDRPMRFNETLRDKLVDQLPPKAWPILKIPFFLISAILVMIIIYASVVAIQNKQVGPGSTADSEPTADQVDQ